MAITNLTFTVSEIPALMHRVDVINFPADEDLFNSKYEANNDHLSGVMVAELNDIKTQLNVFSTEVEVEKIAMSEYSSNATEQARIATEEASDAFVSAATAVEVKNYIDNLVFPTELTYNSGEIDSQNEERDLQNFLGLNFDDYTSDRIEFNMLNARVYALEEIQPQIDDIVKHYSTSSITYTDNKLTEIVYVSGHKVSYTYTGSNLTKTEYTDTEGINIVLTITYTYDIDNNLISIGRA